MEKSKDTMDDSSKVEREEKGNKPANDNTSNSTTTTKVGSEEKCDNPTNDSPPVPLERLDTKTEKPLRLIASHPSVISDLPPDQYPHGVTLASIIIALCLSVFLIALDQTIISTAIPRITDHFESISDIGWYGSAYFLTTTALQPTFGRV